MSAKRLLLVEDDRALADLIGFHFDRAGYQVTRTGDGEEALILTDEIKPDLIILDWMIEGISGIEVCRRLRRRPNTANLPIVMLTARGEEDDRIRGLETGADDYVTKPFSPKELVARAGAVLRRVRPALAAETLDYAGVEMDLAAHRVRRDGKGVALGPDRISPAAPLPRKPRPRLLAPATARNRLAAQRGHRAAHRRRPHPPPAHRAGRAWRKRHRPHGAQRRAMRSTPRAWLSRPCQPRGAAALGRHGKA